MARRIALTLSTTKPILAARRVTRGLLGPGQKKGMRFFPKMFKKETSAIRFATKYALDFVNVTGTKNREKIHKIMANTLKKENFTTSKENWPLIQDQIIEILGKAKALIFLKRFSAFYLQTNLLQKILNNLKFLA